MSLQDKLRAKLDELERDYESACQPGSHAAVQRMAKLVDALEWVLPLARAGLDKMHPQKENQP